MASEVAKIWDSSDRALAVRLRMRDTLKVHLNSHGENLAGYAVVTWDGRGQAVSSINTALGPIGSDLVPTYVKDVLTVHNAVVNDKQASFGGR